MFNAPTAFGEIVHDVLLLGPLSQYIGLLSASNISVWRDMAVHRRHTSGIEDVSRSHALHNFEGHRPHQVVDHHQVDDGVHQLALVDLVSTTVRRNDLFGDCAAHHSFPFALDRG